MDLLEQLRAPLRADGRAHLNNAGVAPTARAAVEAGKRALEKMQGGSFAVEELLEEYRHARGVFAKLVGCERDDVAFFQTCAAAISQAAFGVPLQPGDEILISDQEYPSNAYPWYRAAERAGARVVTVASGTDFALDTGRVIDAIHERTRVVALSWVQFSTGATVDLRAIADAVHARSGWFFIDAIQGLGVIPFDLAASGVDLVAGGTHKWCVGPLGHGFLAFAPGRRHQVRPLMHGAMTYGTPDDRVDPARAPRDDPRRFEPGAPLLVGAIAGAASIELLLRIGIERVHQEALSLSDLVIERARANGYRVRTAQGPVRSPIVTVVPAQGDAKPIVDGLKQQGVFTAARGGGIRISPHVHNTPEDIDRLFVALSRI